MAKNTTKREYPKLVSPKGTFRYPKLLEPDYGTERYPSKDGTYNVTLVFKDGSPEHKKMLAELKPHYDAAVAEATEKFKALSTKARKAFEANGIKKPILKPLFSEVYDKQTDQPTGEVTVRFAMRAAGEYKDGPKAGQRWERKPTIFDAKGNRIQKIKAIWGGTVGKVAYSVSPYFVEGTAAAGLKLSLDAVMIHKLVADGGKSAAEYGLTPDEDDDEDAYVHTEQADEAKAEAKESTDDDGSGDF